MCTHIHTAVVNKKTTSDVMMRVQQYEHYRASRVSYVCLRGSMDASPTLAVHRTGFFVRPMP